MKPLIVLTGPTAAGKTDLSIKLAKKINGAVISADSIQVYKYLDIGSAKIMPDEMQGVKHYLVDELMPDEPFDAFTFQKMAKDAMEEIYANGQIPVIVGGTAFYIQTVTKDVEFEGEDADFSLRKELEKYAKTHGNKSLWERLCEIDPAASRQIHENNVKRVIRAIEFYHKNGSRISEHNEAQKTRNSPYNLAYFVITDERDELYKRIEKRVDIMVENGLVDEVLKLKEMGVLREYNSMQGIGYKEIYSYLSGEITKEDAIDEIKKNTRHFAKRQLTWFRREDEAVFINKADFDRDDDKILKHITDILETKGIK